MAATQRNQKQWHVERHQGLETPGTIGVACDCPIGRNHEFVTSETQRYDRAVEVPGRSWTLLR